MEAFLLSYLRCSLDLELALTGWGPVVKAILWNPGSAYAELAL
jgi:hypothetical protein